LEACEKFLVKENFNIFRLSRKYPFITNDKKGSILRKKNDVIACEDGEGDVTGEAIIFDSDG